MPRDEKPGRDWAALKRAERARKAEAGLVKVEVWVKPSDRPKLRAYVKLINEAGRSDG